LRIAHTVTDTSLVMSNIITDPVPPVTTSSWSDTFTRADAALLGSTETGGRSWVDGGASFGHSAVINNSAAWVATASGNGCSIVQAVSDGTFTGKISVVGDGSARVLFRAASLTSHLCLTRVSGADHSWRLAAVTAGGSPVTIATTSNPPMADGDTFTIIMSGTTITVSINGTQIYTGVETVHAAFAGCGILGTLNTNDVRYDNFVFTAA
jgi:hypothetical protein